jgi:hypothetical protein
MARKGDLQHIKNSSGFRCFSKNIPESAVYSLDCGLQSDFFSQRRFQAISLRFSPISRIFLPLLTGFRVGEFQLNRLDSCE